MHSYAGIYEGEFNHFYYCTTCDELKDALDIDWSEGVSESMEQDVDDAGVFEACRCPNYDEAKAIANSPLFDCEGDISGHADRKSLCFFRKKILWSCTCFTHDEREFELDLMPIAVEVGNELKEHRRKWGR